MKTYKLKAWPDLPPGCRRMGHRRVLNQLSQRHVGEPELLRESGLPLQDLRQLLGHLARHGWLDERDRPISEVRGRTEAVWLRWVWPLQQWRARRAG
ncbi:MAG: hypothetical protein J0M20_00375 [Burkholderiales bacterium]|nr:hypothetical protein [Burkholderiales bacterium]